jgi:hypothetical protein
LRGYLTGLTPQACAPFLGEFERRVAGGDSEVESSVILQELRALAPAKPLDPLELLLVDDAPDRRHPGRLSRHALAPLWNWLACELISHPIES